MEKGLLTIKDLPNQEPSFLETIFSLANGHFGSRGSNPLVNTTTTGTFINGFYENSEIKYGESAFGYAKNHQTIVSLPDLRQVIVKTDDNMKFYTENLLNQTINFNTGETSIQLIASTSDNRQIKLNLKQVLDHLNNSYFSLKHVPTA